MIDILQKINRPSLMRRAINWQVLCSMNRHPAPDHPIAIIVGIIINQRIEIGAIDVHHKPLSKDWRNYST
jgi:hypothetical protein